jgi:hypothetical protein
VRIIGPSTADKASVAGRLAGMGGDKRFVGEMLNPLWSAAERYGIDPAGVVAQSYKETGGGKFGGKVKPEFYNTCGLKIRHQNLYPGVTDGDNPLAHAMFPSWEVGAEAHVQHLRAYAGWPVTDLIVDPRYVLVIGRHACESFAELGGKWAPTASYGTELVAIARKLQVTGR